MVEYTPEPEKTIAVAARQCYYKDDALILKDQISDEFVTRFLGELISSGHHSTLEHASFTFFISGISRACSHQLVRHRIASYSQQSQRYVNFGEGFTYICPPSIKKDKEKLKIFEDEMEKIAAGYDKLGKLGIKPEDARFLLPNAAETKITVTMNARSLLHFFEERTCTRAQWEIRAMATKMLEQAKEVAPIIFQYAGPTCRTQGICWQSEKQSCGTWKTLGGERKDRIAV
ncbi:MAG: FAD-dependent thymidylate synthase [Patescibacteria group bacterium]